MPSSAQGPPGRVRLRRAAVDDHQIGRIRELALAHRRVPFGGIVLRILLGIAQDVQLAGFLAFVQVAPEPAGDHLVDRGDVVGAVVAADAEPAVLALARQAVLEHDHRRHDVRALQVGHVVALDPQRRVVQAERFLDLVQRPAPGGQVAGPPGLVQRQRLHGVARDRVQQRLLVTAPRHPQVDGAAAADGQPFRDRLRLGRQHGHQHLAGHAAARGCRRRRARLSGAFTARLPVDLAEEVLDQFAGRHVLDLFQHPAALAAHPAVADVEDLHGRLELVLGQGDDVAVGPVPEHDGLLFQRPLQRAHVVAQPRGALVLLGRRGLPHLRLDPADEPRGLPGHEVAEILGQLAVLGRAHPVHARGRAFADVAEQAGPADLPGPLEHPGRAGPDREHPEQGVHRVPDRPGVRVGPEVPGALALRAPHHHDPGVLLAHGDREVRVALVVPVLDVVPGVELLDPGVLELEGLHLGADDGPVDPRPPTSAWPESAGAGWRSPRSRSSAAAAGTWPCPRRSPGRAHHGTCRPRATPGWSPGPAGRLPDLPRSNSTAARRRSVPRDTTA